MEQTAKFVREVGGQTEFVLGVKQAANPAFAFLKTSDRLHLYFRWLVRQGQVCGGHMDRRQPAAPRHNVFHVHSCRHPCACWRAPGSSLIVQAWLGQHGSKILMGAALRSEQRLCCCCSQLACSHQGLAAFGWALGCEGLLRAIYHSPALADTDSSKHASLAATCSRCSRSRRCYFCCQPGCLRMPLPMHFKASRNTGHQLDTLH